MMGCMIFAAGFGTRMRPLTDTMPKPLIQVAGRRLIDHAVAPAIEAKLSPIIVNAHYRADQINDAFSGTDITVIDEQPEVLETGGGLKNAAPHFSENSVATMNSDAVWRGPNPFEPLLAEWDPDRMDALLLCVPMERALGRDGRSDFALRDDGQLIRGDGWVYTGAQIINMDRVQNHPERIFSLNEVWNTAAKDGRLFGVEYSGTWCDVGQPSSIALAEGMLADV